MTDNLILQTLINEGRSIPQREYNIDEPLIIPNGAKVIGEGGGFTQNHCFEENFGSFQGFPVINYHGDGAMLTGEFKCVTIKGLILNGNNCALSGIKVDPTEPNRPNFVFEDILVYKCFVGISVHQGNNEFLLNRVCARENDFGFVFRGNQDITINYCWAGSNKCVGFEFINCSSVKVTNCDAWDNFEGFRFYGSGNISLYKIQSQINKCWGIRLINSNNGSLIASQILDNSVQSRGEYSDLLIQSTNPSDFGNFGWKIIGNNFGKYSEEVLVKHAIEDANKNSRSNIILGNSFYSKGYKDIFNENVRSNYQIGFNSTGLWSEDTLKSL